MSRNKNSNTIVYTAITWMFEFAFISIFLILIVLSKYGYPGKKEFVSSNILLLLAAMALMVFAMLACGYFVRSVPHLTKFRPVKISHITVFLFFAQVYCGFNFYFETGWDVHEIIKNARLVAEGITEGLSNSYFSSYPNNVFLMWLFSTMLKLNNAVGILDTQNGLMFIITIQCLLSSITGYLIYKIINDSMDSERLAWAAWFLYFILLGTSPWLAITYSDSMILMVPVLIFRLYQLLRNGRYSNIKWVAIVLLSYWGYRIKPQAVIITIAIIVIETAHLLSKSKKWKLKKIITRAVIIISCILLSQASFHMVINQTGLSLEPEKAIGMSHFMMMGLNKETIGKYSEDDVNFSKSFDTRKERTSANIEIIQKRLKDAGSIGLLKHMVKKTLVNFNDGTFAWGNEGHFYNEIYAPKNDVISPLIRDICWNQGSYFPIFSSIKQAFWLLTLFLSTGVCFGKRRKELSVLLLSLIGIMMFQLLFEARARYLYLYVPIFIIVGTYGGQQWTAVLKEIVTRYKTKEVIVFWKNRGKLK